MKRVLAIVLFIVIFSPISLSFAFGGPVTSPFGGRWHPVYKRYITHTGVDIGIEEGTQVPALSDGKVTLIGYEKGYGNYIEITMPRGDTFLYAHGSYNQPNIHVGDIVKKGQIVFTSGSTGIGTGAHLHVEHRINDKPVNPISLIKEAGWNLTGDTSGNIVIATNEAINAIFNISLDMDYASYFTPSSVLADSAQKIINLVSKVSELITSHIRSLLVLLMIIDLAWYGLQALVLDGVLSPYTFFPKLMRYGFILTVVSAWSYLIKKLFFPTFVAINKLYSGQQMDYETFLKFDTLFTSVSNSIGGYLNLKITGTDIVLKFFPFLLQNICVIVILIICLSLSIWMMMKLINFFLLISFAVLGFPISFIPNMRQEGANIVMVSFSAVFDLVIATFLMSLAIMEVKATGKLEADNTAILILFTLKIYLLHMMVTKGTASMSRTFSSFANTLRL